jgi:hypothetical protein
MVQKAVADEPQAQFELSWQAPEECPEETAFRNQVLRLAGHDTQPESALQAKVSIERSAADSFKLTLQTESEGRSGTRVLQGSSCGAVVDAAALTLALILNPEAVAEGANAPPPPDDARVDAPPPPKKSEPFRPSQRARLRFVGGPELGLQAGTMPSFGPSFGLSFGLGVGDGWAWLTGNFAPPQHPTVEGHPDAGGSLFMISGTALGCWDVASNALVLAPCAGAELSWVRGEGEGVSDPQAAGVYWPSAAFGGALQFELTRRFALRFSALGLVPFKRPALFLEGIGEVHRPAPIAGRASLGAMVDFL